MTALDIARDYLARGWAPLDVPFRRKAPVREGWQNLRLDASALREHFNGHPSNIGVLLGSPSGGLVDVDLDCPEALMLASTFLPATCARFGRASKRASHWLYGCEPVPASEKFQDTTSERPAMLVELRADGCQTVFPGSVHESGEPVEWDEDGECARGDGATLRRAVAALAVAALIARHWPAAGARHTAALALAGVLVRGGVDESIAVRIVQGAALAAGDDEARARKGDVLSTVAAVAAGEPVIGGPSLAEVLRGDGVKVVVLLRKWLGLRTADSGDAPHLTDTGNAVRFVAQHGASFRYCYAWKSWLAWPEGGPRWRRDTGDVAMRCAKETARGLYLEAAKASDDGQRKALAKWAAYAESEPGLRRMLTLAQSELAITPEQLDADPWLLNCPNGTLELRTAHLRPHRREDFLTKLTAAPYDPEARHETWDRFLEEALPDEGARDYAQRYAGYCLTGSTREDVFVFCRGPAGGGKSTYTESQRRTWGDYATTADFSSFLVKRPTDGPREDLARLAGARLVTSVETRDGQRLAEGLVKLLTGGDTIAARRLYEGTFEFTPTFKLLLASNFRPHANAEDEGLWRRLRELPFPTARPKREDRDDSIRATLTDPAQAGPAILAWAVDGCARWLREGLGEPEAVMAASLAYRRSQEPLTDFIAAFCTLGRDLAVPAQRLRDEYETWCRAEGVKHPLSGKAWGQALRALGCTDRRTTDSRWWDGIDLRPVNAEPRQPGDEPLPW